MRTELEKRIRDGDRTLLEFVSYLEDVVAPGETTTISYRHLQRLISGDIAPNSVGAPIRRTLERTLGASIATLLGPPPSKADTASCAAALVVAIAVVARAEDVLLVARRQQSPGTASRWQFPAGIVKPGETCEAVAVEETLLETGVCSEFRGYLGERVHPRTNVQCRYYACTYLWGEAENLDPAENMRVCWVPTSELHALIPREEIFSAVLLELRREAVSPQIATEW